MKWQGRRGSDNIEDRRGLSTGQVGGIGGIGMVAVLIIGYFLGIDVTPLLNDGAFDGQIQNGSDGQITETDQKSTEFVSVTLADTEQVWTEIFQRELGRTYHPTTLVLFKDATQTSCGGATEATGPFYCPGDKKVYLDTGFFATLTQQLGARGDFAAAYVVAHEVGHHVQDELGILGRANDARAQMSEDESNQVSVQIELQADCLSGVWARYAADKLGTLEPGDIQEAVDAAAKIGDDTLQRSAGRTPMPDSFTHGTSQQRQRWLATGYKSGSIKSCDTFSAATL